MFKDVFKDVESVLRQTGLRWSEVVKKGNCQELISNIDVTVENISQSKDTAT